MFWKRIVKLTACLLLLQFAGYLLYFHYGSYRIMFSQLCESGKTGHVMDTREISIYDLSTKKNTQSNQVIKVESSQLPEPIPTVLKSKPAVHIVNKLSTTTKATVVANSNIVKSVAPSAMINDTLSAKLQVQEVADLLKAQLELNNTKTPFSVKIPCVPKPTWNYACVKPNCSQLSKNITERVQSLFSEKTVLTKSQEDLLTSIATQIPVNDVIILTAVSSNHYDEMQGLMHSLHENVFPELSKTENVSLVLWDIGLTSDQRKKTEKCCRCQVISFPFEKFHKRMRDVRCYMWKPMMIRIALLRARKYVVYQDSSIRYIRFPGPVFENGRQQGMQLIRQKAGVSTPHRTLPEVAKGLNRARLHHSVCECSCFGNAKELSLEITFAYLGQDVCSFYPYPELSAGFGVYKHDPFVLRTVLNVWVRCAFEEDCMCPKPTFAAYKCVYGPCHRFDQSALTIITATFYSSEIYRVLLFVEDFKDYLFIDRNSKEINYFNSTGCLS